MNDYPASATMVNHVEPVPRRIRGFLCGRPIFDTTAALYVWEWSGYPQYYVPLSDVVADVLVHEEQSKDSARGTGEVHGLRLGDVYRKGAALVYRASPIAGLADTVRFGWSALDDWFEEDEQVFVHPRSPYTRVDAIRSTRQVAVALDGVVLAESTSPVMVFETGLPTRYYLNRTDLRLQHLSPTTTQTACPYKGTTSGYWSALVNSTRYDDVAWTYDFPTRELLPISGLVAFYNEKVDITLDGRLLPRPRTHFS